MLRDLVRKRCRRVDLDGGRCRILADRQSGYGRGAELPPLLKLNAVANAGVDFSLTRGEVVTGWSWARKDIRCLAFRDLCGSVELRKAMARR
jgi:hypothetical protein